MDVHVLHSESCFHVAALQELDTLLSQSTMPSISCAPASVDAPDSDKRREELDRGNNSQSLSRGSGEKQQDARKLVHGRFLFSKFYRLLSLCVCMFWYLIRLGSLY